MADQQRDIVGADGGELKDFELDMKVGDTQGMDTILAKFIILGSLPDVAFVTAEEFNTILNSCSDVFELRLSCDGNGPIQAMVEKMVLPVKYADFADVFFPTLAHELLSHTPHDHTIKIGDGQPPFGPIYPLSAVELNVLKKLWWNRLVW